MKETLIKPFTAKIAKIKGFEWNTRFFYDDKEKVCECTDEYKHCNNKLVISNLFSYNANGVDKFTMTAPTQSHLQKWIKHKYKIDIVIVPIQVAQYISNIYQYVKNGSETNIQVTIVKNDRKPTVFNSYEDALEATLLYCMKEH